jgi:predicted  nucleic acid-binding Zn-ribbon protein
VVFLPEGAEYQAASETPYEVQKSGFSENIEFLEANVTQINEPTITLQYQYFILWAAFRPALWTGTAVIIFLVLFFARRLSKPSAAVVAGASFTPSLLRDFVNRYEEKRRLRSELETMEDHVEKGKLSRRRYRLRKSSIDDHLSRLEKDLSGLRKKIATAGGQYSERIRHLETAEAEIETLKKDIERAKMRFLRKEITAEAYRKLLEEYSRMKERAENTMEEVLLRLREDFR